MSKQLKWAIGGLALLIVGFVALQVYLYVDMKRFREELAGPEPKTETEQPPEQVQVPEVDNRPPDDGREYVWHGDHWDPVDSTHATTPPPSVVEKQGKYEGALTYHAELLETHPSEALALQSEERGHWSAKYIKGFAPADDHVAQDYARLVYLQVYYNHLYSTTGEIPIPYEEYEQLWEDIRAHRKSWDAYRHLPVGNPGGRVRALTQLGWPLISRNFVVSEGSVVFPTYSDFLKNKKNNK